MANKQRRRRLTQFSLRTLLILTTVVAAYIAGWLSNEWRHEQKAQSNQAVTTPNLPVTLAPFIVTPPPEPWRSKDNSIEQGMKVDELEMKERLQTFQDGVTS